MSSSKITSGRNQKILSELAAHPGNDVCADCKARAPRWASYNLGVFICVNCASIHRKIGTHITKVKSLTMDSWTKEQVERMKEMGNLNSNAIYCPNELRHPPPPMLTEDERDSELEKYIRAKYEYKKFFDKHALVVSKLGPSRSSSIIAPRMASNPTSPTSSRPPTFSSSPSSTTLAQTRSVSQPILSPIPPATSAPVAQIQPRSHALLPTSASTTSRSPNPSGGVWNDLVSLQAPSANSSLPLQYQQSQGSAGLGPPNLYSNMTSLNSAGFPPMSTGISHMNGVGYSTGMGAGPNGLTINPGPTPPIGMGLANSSLAYSSGMPQNGTNSFQPQQFSAMNPFAGFPTSATLLPSAASGTFGDLPAGLSPSFMAQQQALYQAQAFPMISHGQMQPQSPAPMFSPVPQNYGQFGNGAMQMHGGHSPQPPPQMQMSTTPQFVSSPSPQLQMNTMGMGMGVNGQQQQMQMGMGSGGPWGQQQQQQQQQPAMFGQQWGTM
ncbi:hypothetical protein D9757_000833 [Collybiopsis confluens]|uniref:Arf-GAP domain-containing protein n=1 Tax=Collybiopsis confluens TaxID=2823264 RepID=A0A8H5MG64_9AGAR|nr:hypothetical protein D9757_000833 [Collybiopsis confluens]